MPADLISGRTFRELLRDFAEYAGLSSYGELGNGKADIPTDEHDLDQCKRFVNRGYKLFLQADQNWSFSHHPIEFMFDPTGNDSGLINSDPSRIALPPFVRTFPKGNLRYQDNQSTYRDIVPVRPDVIERWRQQTRSSGTPTHFSVRAIPDAEQSDGSLSRYELILYPTPTATNTVRGDWRIVPYDLRELDERHVAGADHDETILAAAKFLWDLRDRENADESAFAKSAVLAASQQIDRRNRPKHMGYLKPAGVPRSGCAVPFDGLVRRMGNRTIT